MGFKPKPKTTALAPLTEEQQTMVDEVCGFVQATYDHKVTLTGHQVMAILDKHAATEDDAERDLAVIQQILTDDDHYSGDIPDELPSDDEDDEAGITPEMRDAMSATDFGEDVLSVARVMNSDPELVKSALLYVEGDTNKRLMPAAVASRILAKFTEEQIKEWPQVGSKYNDKGIENTNNPYDVGKPGELGYYAKIAISMDQGVVLKLRNIALAQATGGGPKDAAPVELPDDCKGKSQKWLESALTTSDNELKKWIEVVRRGAFIAKAKYILKEHTQLRLDIRMLEEGSDTLLKTHEPLQVYYLKESTKDGKATNIIIDRYVAVSTFINVLDQKKKTNKWAAMLKTQDADTQLGMFVISRGRKGGTRTKQPIVVTSASQMAEAFYETAFRLSSANPDQAMFIANMHRLAQGEDGGEFIDSLDVVVKTVTHEILRKKEYQEKMLDFRRKQAEKNKDEKPAEKAA